MPPAARLTDMHVCPMVTPGLPPVPHAGGPISGPGMPTVMTGMLPQARSGDMAVCVGPPDAIVMGAFTVLVGGQPAARMGDQCIHGGAISFGLPTVMIGGSAGVGNPFRAANFFTGQQAGNDTCALQTSNGIAQQAGIAARTEAQMQTIGTATGAYTVGAGTTNEATIMTAAGVPATMQSGTPTIAAIQTALAQGSAVVVGLDARAIWGNTGPNPIGHAIRVTGVELDTAGNPTAVYINDTGTGQAAQRVPAATFNNSVNGWGGSSRMATSNSPVP